MEIAAFLALALIASVAVAFSSWQTTRVVGFIEKVYHDGTHYGANTMAVASAISKSIDDRTQARVRVTNAILQNQPQAPSPLLDPIEDPPPIRMAGLIDDDHEIVREARRFRRSPEPGVREILTEEV